MRKINNNNSNNNKFRNNTIYSLNYKFDSVSSAGKISGTALDLIKKYNELAKEAHSNGNYVEMEVFRQYAEHYRKIVTEINERRNQSRDNTPEAENENKPQPEAVEKPAEETPVETTAETPVENKEASPKKRRNFKIIEISGEAEKLPAEEKTETKPRRRVLRRKTENAAEENTTPVEAEGQN